MIPSKVGLWLHVEAEPKLRNFWRVDQLKYENLLKEWKMLVTIIQFTSFYRGNPNHFLRFLQHQSLINHHHTNEFYDLKLLKWKKLSIADTPLERFVFIIYTDVSFQLKLISIDANFDSDNSSIIRRFYSTNQHSIDENIFLKKHLNIPPLPYKELLN